MRTFVLREQRNFDAMLRFISANWPQMASGKPMRAMQVVCSAYDPRRNSEQNAKLYSLERDIAAAAWIAGKQYSPEAWHEFFLDKLAPRIDGVDGPRIKRSSSMTVAELSSHISAIQAYAATELGLEPCATTQR